MGNIIVHETPTAGWQALIEEAEKVSAIHLTEEVESYLVFLLMRFINQPELIQSILGTDFLESLSQIREQRLQNLREVGDKCLLYAGLFPGRAKRRRVPISYFVKLGQIAYSSLSTASHLQLSGLYAMLCHDFVILMDILHTLRELDDQDHFLDLLQATELWHDTGSLHALKTLRKMTTGFMPPYTPNTFLKH